MYWDRVPAAAIDRVEVVRGGASDLYGADALVGVLQVVTRAADGAGAARGGRGGHARLGAAVGVRRRQSRPVERLGGRRGGHDRRLHPGGRGRPRRGGHAGRRRLRRGAGGCRLSGRRRRLPRASAATSSTRTATTARRCRPTAPTCGQLRAAIEGQAGRTSWRVNGQVGRPDVPSGVLVDRRRSHERDADRSTARAGVAARRGRSPSQSRVCGHRPAGRCRHARGLGHQHRRRVLSRRPAARDDDHAGLPAHQWRLSCRGRPRRPAAVTSASASAATCARPTGTKVSFDGDSACRRAPRSPGHCSPSARRPRLARLVVPRADAERTLSRLPCGQRRDATQSVADAGASAFTSKAASRGCRAHGARCASPSSATTSTTR